LNLPRSHWGFTSEYCNPASGNEKGGVEGEVGRYGRNWLVPVPEPAIQAVTTPSQCGRERLMIALPGFLKQRRKSGVQERMISRPLLKALG
jgi:hypothetical protein